jgi:hypothetical protein
MGNLNVYMEGWVTAYSGTSLSMNVDLINGSGSYSAWYLNLSGAPGAGYAATSASPLSIVTGPTTLTTQLGLAYSPGARVRVSAQTAPTNWIEGIVTAYSPFTGTLAVAVDTIGGSGAFTAWNINIAGQPGAPASIALATIVFELSARVKAVEAKLQA